MQFLRATQCNILHITQRISSHSCFKYQPFALHCCDRMLELSLSIVGVEAAWIPHNDSTLGEVKRQYRQLSMLVHPDRCSHTDADKAFAALAQAMQIISQHASGQLAAELQAVGSPLQSQPGDDEQGALQLYQSGGYELQQLLWTPQRLVLEAVMLSDEVLPFLPTHHARHTADDALLFIPTTAIPALSIADAAVQPRQASSALEEASTPLQQLAASLAASDVLAGAEPGHPGQASSPLQDQGSPGLELELSLAIGSEAEPTGHISGTETSAENSQVQDLEADMVAGGQEDAGAGSTGDAGAGPEFVEGLLLVACRAALHGRFPLAGTYFQTNEVFVDATTIHSHIRVRGARNRRAALVSPQRGRAEEAGARH